MAKKRKAPPRAASSGPVALDLDPSTIKEAWWSLLDDLAVAEASDSYPDVATRHRVPSSKALARRGVVQVGTFRTGAGQRVRFTDAGRVFYQAHRPSRSVPSPSVEPPRRPVAEVIEAELVVEETAIAVPEGSPSRALAGIQGTGRITDAAEILTMWLDDKGERTVQNYQTDLGDFAAWFLDAIGHPEWSLERGRGREVPLQLIPVAMHDFCRLPQPMAHAMGMKYRTWLEKTLKLSPNTINRHLAALRSYLKLARAVGGVHWELLVEGVTTELVRDTEGPGAEACEDLIKTAKRIVEEARDSEDPRALPTALRNKALLHCYYDRAFRRFEPLTADYPDDVDLRRLEKARLRVRRKHRKTKQFYAINRRTAKAIRAWIEVRGKDPGPLFCSLHHGHKGKRLNPRSAAKVLDKLCKASNSETHLHGLRHSAATKLLEDGHSVREVAEFLGHKSLNIVQIYDDQRKAAAKRMTDTFDDDED